MQIEIGYPKGGATFKDMEARFNQLPLELRADAYGKAVYDGAKDVAAQAIATAPVWAGRAPDKAPTFRYADNIFAIKVRRYRSSLPRAYAWARAYHANLVEWGTKRYSGRHTMARAAEVMAPRVARHFERRVRNALRTIARQLSSGKISKKVGRALATFADRD